jgi:hypothetical protein
MLTPKAQALMEKLADAAVRAKRADYGVISPANLPKPPVLNASLPRAPITNASPPVATIQSRLRQAPSPDMGQMQTRKPQPSGNLSGAAVQAPAPKPRIDIGTAYSASRAEPLQGGYVSPPAGAARQPSARDFTMSGVGSGGYIGMPGGGILGNSDRMPNAPMQPGLNVGQPR